MCILCVVQRWSRRVATMLPWLVLPLILLWAFSQLLPPGFRFEVTSPRLACVSVLLLTLFWYEILLPHLSIWRARRSARLRERRRAQALELQKLRKTATRRCRNCLTPYRDQNPPGGRFMCTCCGHVSKRPVLDIPGAKSGWICNQDWPTDGAGNWVGPDPRHWFDDRCSTEKSYSGAVVSAFTLLSCFFSSVGWLCRKVFRFGSGEDGSSDGDNKGLSKRGESEGNSQESRGEKARRKAEEKRQARLEKEMLEEEERKQREEVARLVEERRKLRDEKMEAEERSKGATPVGERESRKEAERRRQERRKEKDKGSSKSNSDVEDVERRSSRESERKREFDKKGENERPNFHKGNAENAKLHSMDSSYGNKVTTSKPKYFGHMADNFLTSSRGFPGNPFFRRNNQSSSAASNKVSKSAVGFNEHSYAIKRDAQSAAQMLTKSSSTGDDRIGGASLNRPVSSDVQPRTTAPKKSWHHLFTGSPAVSPYPDMSSSSCQNQHGNLEPHSVKLTNQRLLPNYPLDSQMGFRQSTPCHAYPPINGPFSSPSFSHFTAGPMFPAIKEPGPTLISEEPELFEDPCFDADAIALLGPVSESLDNFPLDLGTGFVSSDKTEASSALKSVSSPGEVNKPSPIESPLSRSRVSEEKNTTIGQFSCSSKPQEFNSSNMHDSFNEQGTWQMWGTPLAQEGLGFTGGPSSWLFPIGQNKFGQENVLSLSHNPMIPQITNGNHALPAIRSPRAVPGVNQQNGGTFSPLSPNLNGNNPWAQKSPFQPLPVEEESHFLPLNLMENIACKNATYEFPNRPEATLPVELSQADCWPKNEWVRNGTLEAGTSTPVSPHIGSLFSTNPDVQSSVWSFDQRGENLHS
uniref:Stress response protein nst1 n=1 Tax=Ananas comosus var. bracteatus TaxID=296719 RepID=A0A6V7NFZ0_ANACO|nr:unnamed protein product [Ananas comosus var. bracteatus]